MNFRSSLRSFLFRWRTGLLLTGIFRAVVIAAVLLLALCAFDFFAGLTDKGRRIAFAIWALGTGVGLVWALWDAITFMRRDAALTADGAIANGRREVLSALELNKQSPGETALARWLQERTVQSAAERLAALPVARSMPLRALGKRVLQCAGLAAVFGAIAMAFPVPFRIVGQRILQPGADIPPYSPLQFTLAPNPAEVLYGGELVVTAEISGGKPDAPVRCITRDPATGRIDETPAFQESPVRFARKLEKVTAPIEVAFTVGRARSAWMSVAVRTQPKIQDVLVTVEPPAYSGMPKREFAAGTQDLVALPGSRITARVTSNRPLADGRLAISQPVADIAGTREDTHRIAFSWIAKSPARLTFVVRDVIATSSEPLQLEQKLLPDERPAVALLQPSGEILATPDTELPLEATASDDIGLTRVALVRKLVGYRERSETAAIQSGIRSHRVNGMINLAAFGVVPGQTIELTLEAGDTNPTLLGASVSDPAKIHIITREQYAEMLRNQTTLAEFVERYAALSEAMQEARKSLDELEAAAKTGDAAKTEEARKKAFEAHAKAAQTYAKIAKDFPIFDTDTALSQAAGDVAEKLLENGKELDGLAGASPGEAADAVPEMKKRLGESEKRMEKEMQKGERVAAAAKVVEQAGRFKEMLEKQRNIVKDFNRTIEQIRRGETKAGPALQDLARQQREISSMLQDIEKEMGEALKALPEEFAEMKEQGSEFLEMLQEQKVPEVMNDAAKAADASDSKAAGEQAAEALKRLEELLKKDNAVCKMCKGEGAEKFPWPQDLSQTMQQLMNSLIPKPGGGNGSGKKPGSGGGEGTGPSGDSESGYSMQGNMPRLPMFGPPRSRTQRSGGPQMGGAGKSGQGKGKDGPERDAEVGRDAMTSETKRPDKTQSATAEAIPENYREAVKRYFSAEPATNPSKP